MANATTAIRQSFKNPELIQTRVLTVASANTIYEGTLVGIDDAGKAIVVATNKKAAGIAKNTATAGESVTIYYGLTVRLVKSDAAATDVGVAMYAADNQTATASANTAILGYCQSFETGYVWVNLSLFV